MSAGLDEAVPLPLSSVSSAAIETCPYRVRLASGQYLAFQRTTLRGRGRSFRLARSQEKLVAPSKRGTITPGDRCWSSAVLCKLCALKLLHLQLA
jgi:hypothetical protein